MESTVVMVDAQGSSETIMIMIIIIIKMILIMIIRMTSMQSLSTFSK